MDTPDIYQRELKIDADAATVFAFFTDPQRLMRWVGVSADLDPRPGGLYLLDVDGSHVVRGEFKEVVPVSRLAYTFGWQNRADVPPGSSLIEIDLTPTNGSTVVHFKHSGLPPAAVPDHTSGWNHYLDRLIIAASGRDPGPDPGPDSRSQTGR
ncbi:MAG TPA: SRPBCC family protein [Candidatus Binataceae bacterium]|nr:SRPBCC family protein [Candidatus Binataceae bacterium]